MRLDKFLKVSRLIKRRTLAKQICDAGRVFVGNRVAKASTVVRVDDTLTIRYGQKTVTVKVLVLLDNPRKDMASQMYELLIEQPNEVIESEFVDEEHVE